MHRSAKQIALAFSLFLSLSASDSDATGVPKIVHLEPTNLDRLGFTFESHPEDKGFIATLTGPELGPNGCSAAGSGAALFNSEGQELMAVTSYFHSPTRGPRSVAYAKSDSDKLSIWIDYFCEKERVLDSSRYYIDSVSHFIATKEAGE